VRLFTEHGYEQTTAAGIAAEAGLTERTFFRYFADKREVLFDGSPALAELIVRGVRDARADLGPLGMAASGVLAAAEFFDDERRAYSRTRQELIDTNPALQERERQKFAELADAIGRELRERGVADLPARLAAESAVVVFTTTFRQWISAGEHRTFDAIATEMLASLKAIVAG